jgi:hypothetical protein
MEQRELPSRGETMQVDRRETFTSVARERRFYLWTAALIAVVTFAGFARTYYLRGFFHTRALTLFLHIHGAVMTGWIVLFLVQSLLIAGHRVRLHRRLGVLGACLGALVVILGTEATLVAAAREVRGHTGFVPMQLSILALELTQLLLFAWFLGTALLQRRRPDVHKRYMLLATLCMLPNPEVRMLPFIQNNLVILLLWSAVVFVLVAADGARSGRIHPSFVRGAAIANAALYIAYFGSQSAGWRNFASHVVA